MKVLMVIERYSPIWGGAENQLRELCLHLVQNGCEVSVVTRRWEWGMPARDLVDGVPVRRVGLSLGNIHGSLAFAAARCSSKCLMALANCLTCTARSAAMRCS